MARSLRAGRGGSRGGPRFRTEGPAFAALLVTLTPLLLMLMVLPPARAPLIRRDALRLRPWPPTGSSSVLSCRFRPPRRASLCSTSCDWPGSRDAPRVSAWSRGVGPGRLGRGWRQGRAELRAGWRWSGCPAGAAPRPGALRRVGSSPRRWRRFCARPLLGMMATRPTDRRARRPSGAEARASYGDPLYHWPNFRAILAELSLGPRTTGCSRWAAAEGPSSTRR